MASSSKVNGSWKDNSGWYVKVDGAWKAVSYGYTKTNGTWKSFLVPTPTPTPVFTPTPTPVYTPTPTPVYTAPPSCSNYTGPCDGSCCPFGSYSSPCGTYGNGTRYTCVTPVGCANVPGPCLGDYAPTPTPTPVYTAPTPVYTVPIPTPTPYTAPTPTPTPYSVYPIPTPTPYTAPRYVAPIPTPTPYTAPRFVDPYYGVGNPCIQGDTMVLVSVDGLVTTKKAREVEIGDLVVSLNFSEIDKDDPDWNLYEWMSESLTFVDPQVSKVINKTQSVHPKVAYFNGRVEATFSEFHPFLVRRGGVYEFYTVSTLLPGDTIFNYNNETNTVDPLVIETVSWLEGATDAYNFSVEAYDIVIAGGYVTHNK